MISDRFEDFAQSLRVFTEQKMRFRELFLVDQPEAIGNVEFACSNMLNSFSSLYDASRAEPKCTFDFYAAPLCCCVLAYRNAKHHNNANGVRSAHRVAQRGERQDFLMVDFPAGDGEEGGGFIDHFVSWQDLRALLEMPSKQNRLPDHAKQIIRERIRADTFEAFADTEGVEYERVFINVIPIIIGGGSEFIDELSPFIDAQSVEAEHFLWHFKHVEQANFARPDYVELPSTIFG